MSVYIMKAAMQGRPYILNEEALPAGYWQAFYSRSDAPWQPPRFRVERKSGKLGDVLGWIGGVPLFSKAAVELLSDITDGKLQFVVFGDVRNAPYWIISKVPTVPDLSSESVANAEAVFCLPGNELREVLVKESVPKLVVAKRLTGFEFRAPDQPHLKALFMGRDVNAFPGVLP